MRRIVLLGIAVAVSASALMIQLVHGDLLAKPSTNPDAGLTDSQRAAIYNNEWNSFSTRYQAWLPGQDLSAAHLHTLVRADQAGSYLPGQSSLTAAVAAAEDVVAVTVKSISPTPFSGTAVSVTVTTSYKGGLAGDVVITQGGTISPEPDWVTAEISDPASDHLLLPGDQAILFLYRPGGSELDIQSFTGEYMINPDGSVTALPGNPFGGGITGQPAAYFANQIAQSLGGQ